MTQSRREFLGRASRPTPTVEPDRVETRIPCSRLDQPGIEKRRRGRKRNANGENRGPEFGFDSVARFRGLLWESLAASLPWELPVGYPPHRPVLRIIEFRTSLSLSPLPGPATVHVHATPLFTHTLVRITDGGVASGTASVTGLPVPGNARIMSTQGVFN